MSVLTSPALPFDNTTAVAGREAGGSREQNFEASATRVLAGLQRAISELLEASPGETRRAADVERAFAVDHRLGWQVFQIANAENPLAVAAHVPARVSIQKLLKSATRRRVPAAVIRQVSEAYDHFEKLVEDEAGDRAEMEAMVGAFIPEVREKKELAARQAAFKAMSQIRGVAVEADFMAVFLRPAADGSTIDRAALSGELGLRRVRPDARIVLSSGDLSHTDHGLRTLDGRSADGPFGALLPQFSSSPLPRVESENFGDMTYSWIAGDDVGMRSAVDIVMADQRRAAMGRYRDAGGDGEKGSGSRTSAGAFRVVDTPTKRMTVDIFVHRELFADTAPSLAVFNTVGRGLVRLPDSPTRDNDRLNVTDSVRPLAGGIHLARLPHIARYTDMLAHVYTTLGWDPSVFRGYRLDVEYPVYGAQYTVCFQLPEAPGVR